MTDEEIFVSLINSQLVGMAVASRKVKPTDIDHCVEVAQAGLQSIRRLYPSSEAKKLPTSPKTAASALKKETAGK